MTDLPELSLDEFNALTSDSPEPLKAVFSVCPLADGMIAAANMLARLVAASPDSCFSPPTILIPTYTVAEFKTLSRALGTFTKTADDNYFNCTRNFDGGVKIQVYIARSQLCEKVQVGTKIIPAVPAQPEREAPVYEWRCGDSAKRVTAAVTPAILPEK